MIEFCLIRHGETEENALKICQGQTPGTLTKEGILQAKAAGEFLKDEHFVAFYSSDLKRTMESAAQITQFHPELEIIPEKLLRERYLAAWQGKPFPKNWKDMDLPEGAETAEDLIVRAKQFIQLLKEKHEGQKIAAMSHGGLIRAFWTVLSGLNASDYYNWEAPKNTSISRFELFEDGTVKTVVRNQTEHLELATINLESKNKDDWQL